MKPAPQTVFILDHIDKISSFFIHSSAKQRNNQQRNDNQRQTIRRNSLSLRVPHENRPPTKQRPTE